MAQIAEEKSPAREQQSDLGKMVREGRSDEQIHQAMVDRFGDGPAVAQLMQEVKKLRAAKNTATGLIFILAGVVILLSSFVLSFMHVYNNQSLTFVLYGLTTIGILVVFFGLMKVFS
jgi:cytochrome c-type biogenesis protein CcmH/NrfF